MANTFKHVEPGSDEYWDYIENRASKQALVGEIRILLSREATFEETDQQWDMWAKEFFTANKLDHLYDPFINFISSKVEELEERSE